MDTRNMWFGIFALLIFFVISLTTYQFFQKIDCSKKDEDSVKLWKNIVMVTGIVNLLLLLFLWLNINDIWWLLLTLVPLIVFSSIQSYYTKRCGNVTVPIITTLLEVLCACLVIYHQFTKSDAFYMPRVKKGTVSPPSYDNNQNNGFSYKMLLAKEYPINSTITTQDNNLGTVGKLKKAAYETASAAYGAVVTPTVDILHKSAHEDVFGKLKTAATRQFFTENAEDEDEEYFSDEEEQATPYEMASAAYGAVVTPTVDILHKSAQAAHKSAQAAYGAVVTPTVDILHKTAHEDTLARLKTAFRRQFFV